MAQTRVLRRAGGSKTEAFGRKTDRLSKKSRAWLIRASFAYTFSCHLGVRAVVQCCQTKGQMGISNMF